MILRLGRVVVLEGFFPCQDERTYCLGIWLPSLQPDDVAQLPH